MDIPDELRERVLRWRIACKPPEWVREELEAEGIEADQINAVIDQVYDARYRATTGRRRRNRRIGWVIAGIGLIANVITLTWPGIPTQAAVVAILVLVYGALVVCLPDFLDGFADFRPDEPDQPQ